MGRLSRICGRGSLFARCEVLLATQSLTLPIRVELISEAERLRAEFSSERPLKDFIILENFLLDPVAKHVEQACRESAYSTRCLYQRDGERELHWDFFEPQAGYNYGAIIQRARDLPASLRELVASFESRPFLDFLSHLSGVELLSPRIWCNSLTCLEAGDFLNPHSDSEHMSPDDDRIVVNISLTRDWRKEYGGITSFLWAGEETGASVVPAYNSAIIFRANERSRHWVSQLTDEAPARQRFTWTLTYDQAPSVAARA